MEKWIVRIGDKLSGIETTLCVVGIILLIHTWDMKNSLSRIAKEVAADNVEAVDTSHNIQSVPSGQVDTISVPDSTHL